MFSTSSRGSCLTVTLFESARLSDEEDGNSIILTEEDGDDGDGANERDVA